MKHLIPDFWKIFKKNDGKFDGIKFESLIKELLPILGVNNLTETKISWDRSRDFQDKKKKIWAECKIYEENISIKIISPTLVMAVIDKPSIIYFFSYSPLNKNAIKHLSQFQGITGVKVIVFDDVNLESLILSNIHITKSFFPKFEYKDIPEKYLYSTQINFSKDPEVEYYGEEIENPRIKDLYIYSIFSIDIFIRNHSIINDLNGDLSVVSSDSNALFLLNKSIRNDKYKVKIQIHKGSLFFYRFYFKVLKCGNINLPDFILRLHNSEKQEKIRLNSKTIRVSSIIKTPLIGKNYIRILNRFKELIQCRNQPVFINVFGESGTGKSRILLEYSEVLFEEEFSILNFNGEDTEEVDFQIFVKKILSRVYKLPLIQDHKNPYITNSENEFIYNLLYNSNFIARNEIEKCVDFFLSGILANKVALIIDNLQNFDEASLNFINSIISRIQNTPLKFVLISCFNTNLIYTETKAFELFERFKLKNNGNTFFNEEIIGFDENAYELFLDNCIRSVNDEKDTPFSLKYPETVGLFKKNVLNRPLFIEQTLLYLEQEQAIKRLDDRFYISDISLFNNILTQDFPKNLGELIYKRWKLIETAGKSNHCIKSFEETLKFLCFFNKIDYKYIIENENIRLNIHFLEKLGFIKIDERDKISFYHHQLFLCFRKYFKKYSKKDYTYYLNFLKKNSLTDIFFHQYFILSEKLDIVDEKILKNAIDKISLNFQYEDFLIPFVYSVHNILINQKINIEKDIILKVFLKQGKILQVFQNMNDRVTLLQDSRKFILENETEFMSYGTPYIDFNHGLANAYITVHKDSNAVQVLNKTVEDIINYSFKDDFERDNGLGKIYNRLCVVYKALDLKKEALFFGGKSLEIAERISNNELKLKNYIDIANVYGRDIKNKSKILSLWNSAVVLYHENKNDLNSQRAMIQLYEAQVYLLEGDTERGIQLLEDGVKYCEAHSNFFFGIKYLLLIILSNISLNINISYSKLQSYINKAIDWAIRYQVNRVYWKVLFIEGKLYFKFNIKDKNVISEIFIQSLEQFQLAITNSQTEEYNLNYFIDLTCFFKRNGNTEKLNIYNQMIESLHSMVVKEKIYTIMQMNNKEFNVYSDVYKPLSIYNDGKFDYPIIG